MCIEGIADESSGIVEAKIALILHQSSKPSIVPPIPDCNQENGEQILEFLSPFQLVSSMPNCSVSPIEDNPSTPKESIFDPFASGSDKFMLAPLRRKYTDESWTKVVRSLNFSCTTKLVRDIIDLDEATTDTTCDEDHLFENMYYTILDAIVSEQSKELVERVPTQVSDLDGLSTLKSAPHLSWVAEICPGAPMKASSKYRNIDKELRGKKLRRKLEF